MLLSGSSSKAPAYPFLFLSVVLRIKLRTLCMLSHGASSSALDICFYIFLKYFILFFQVGSQMFSTKPSLGLRFFYLHFLHN
jgi:hypothetical protein